MQAMQWEYHNAYVEQFGVKHGMEMRENLAAMGRNGWELVSTTPVSNSGAFPGNTSYLLLIFKRPVVVPAVSNGRHLAATGA